MCNASLAVVDVEPGKICRLRFVGGTVFTFASLAFEAHESLTLIEGDGRARYINVCQLMAETATDPTHSLLQVGADNDSASYSKTSLTCSQALPSREP